MYIPGMYITVELSSTLTGHFGRGNHFYFPSKLAWVVTLGDLTLYKNIIPGTDF